MLTISHLLSPNWVLSNSSKNKSGLNIYRLLLGCSYSNFGKYIVLHSLYFTNNIDRYNGYTRKLVFSFEVYIHEYFPKHENGNVSQKRRFPNIPQHAHQFKERNFNSLQFVFFPSFYCLYRCFHFSWRRKHSSIRVYRKLFRAKICFSLFSYKMKFTIH